MAPADGLVARQHARKWNRNVSPVAVLSVAFDPVEPKSLTAGKDGIARIWKLG